MDVRVFINRHLLECTTRASINSVEASLLQQSFLVVIDQQRFVGLLTLPTVLASGHRLVLDCVQSVPAISPDCTVTNALRIMDAGGFLALPVFEDDAFLGVITNRDLMRYLEGYQHELEEQVQARTADLNRAMQQLEQLDREKENFSRCSAMNCIRRSLPC